MISPVVISSSSNIATPTPDSTATATDLGFDFQPNEYDVICARGNSAFTSPGNRRFRQLVAAATERYAATKSKAQRSTIVSDIIDAVRSRAAGGFVKQNNDGSWIEVGDTLAREKTGQLFRNALQSKYKSSHDSKKRRRATTSTHFHQALSKIVLSNQSVRDTTLEMIERRNSASSDEEVLDLFLDRTSFLLGAIKADRDMVYEFQCAFSKGMP
jgi:hypothetical protein